MAKQLKAYIARDKNGDLYLYTALPKLREDGTFIAPTIVNDKKAFPEVGKCESRKVVITLDEE